MPAGLGSRLLSSRSRRSLLSDENIRFLGSPRPTLNHFLFRWLIGQQMKIHDSKYRPIRQRKRVTQEEEANPAILFHLTQMIWELICKLQPYFWTGVCNGNCGPKSVVQGLPEQVITYRVTLLTERFALVPFEVFQVNENSEFKPSKRF